MQLIDIPAQNWRHLTTQQIRMIVETVKKHGDIEPVHADLQACFTRHGNKLIFWFNVSMPGQDGMDTKIFSETIDRD